jgi:membrane fusion protein (multidrug efflux system)
MVRRRQTMALLTLLPAAAACTGKAAPRQAPPPTEVSVVTVTRETVPETFDFVGTVQAYRSVEVRTPVSGIITARPFREGATVRPGEVLYQIDKTVYLAAYQSAQAALQNAQRNVERLKPLLADHAVAQKDFDDAETVLLQAQAAYDEARKNLDDTTVRAEIAGRVGKANLELGARVSGSADLLTTIDQLEPIYVSFRPSTQQLLAWRSSPRTAGLLRPGSPLGIQVTLPDGSVIPNKGTLDYIDPVLDASTGTQQFRARFGNPDRRLVPGQFVRVQITGIVEPDAIAIPQRAVQQQMGRRLVYLVGQGDTVSARDIVVGRWSGDRWLVDQGLAAGDRVIVDGFQKTGPGAVVHPVEWKDQAALAPIARLREGKSAGD